MEPHSVSCIRGFSGFLNNSNCMAKSDDKSSVYWTAKAFAIWNSLLSEKRSRGPEHKNLKHFATSFFPQNLHFSCPVHVSIVAQKIYTLQYYLAFCRCWSSHNSSKCVLMRLARLWVNEDLMPHDSARDSAVACRLSNSPHSLLSVSNAFPRSLLASMMSMFLSWRACEAMFTFYN